mmetsp:Transcript_17691/g.39217  ORF Transcript_17691/g.39217 Transcript_17691/m.39217 type:complete len:94 (+) Transcript_17691:52-333(+)
MPIDRASSSSSPSSYPPSDISSPCTHFDAPLPRCDSNATSDIRDCNSSKSYTARNTGAALHPMQRRTLRNCFFGDADSSRYLQYFSDLCRSRP